MKILDSMSEMYNHLASLTPTQAHLYKLSAVATLCAATTLSTWRDNSDLSFLCAASSCLLSSALVVHENGVAKSYQDAKNGISFVGRKIQSMLFAPPRESDVLPKMFEPSAPAYDSANEVIQNEIDSAIRRRIA